MQVYLLLILILYSSSTPIFSLTLPLFLFSSLISLPSSLLLSPHFLSALHRCSPVCFSFLPSSISLSIFSQPYVDAFFSSLLLSFLISFPLFLVLTPSIPLSLLSLSSNSFTHLSPSSLSPFFSSFLSRM